MKEIKLTQSLVAFVDDTDFDYINKFKWHAIKACNNFYAGSCVGGKRGNVRMHRLILNQYDPTIHIDHKDGNGLNNQRDNIRICTHAQNQHNRGANRNSRSKYVGVAFSTRRGEKRWLASIKIDNKQKSLGIFPYTAEGEILAAKARDKAAIGLYGEFARLNFKQTPTT